MRVIRQKAAGSAGRLLRQRTVLDGAGHGLARVGRLGRREADELGAGELRRQWRESSGRTEKAAVTNTEQTPLKPLANCPSQLKSQRRVRYCARVVPVPTAHALAILTRGRSAAAGEDNPLRDEQIAVTGARTAKTNMIATSSFKQDDQNSSSA